MAEITPTQLVLKCYGYRTGENKWVGVCLNFNLAVEAESSDTLIQKMGEVISSYIEAVLDTEDKASIPELLSRHAPISDWLKYYFISGLFFATRLKRYFTFKEAIPFHLAHSC